MASHYSYDCERGEAALNHLCIDDLLAGANKQGIGAVAPIIEAMLLRISSGLPHIKEIALQSDNAKCYLGKELLLTLALLSRISKVKVARFTHSEAQDGKPPLDGHFARAFAWLMVWMRMGSSALTAAQIAAGLKNGGGSPSSIAQLESIGVEKADGLFSALGPMAKKLPSCFSRANDAIFDYPADCQGSLGNAGLRKSIQTLPEIHLTAFERSGIDGGDRFKLSFQDGVALPSHSLCEERASHESQSILGDEGGMGVEEVEGLDDGADQEKENASLAEIESSSQDPKHCKPRRLAGARVISGSALRAMQRRWRSKPQTQPREKKFA